jgi:hypothetical protein
MIDIIKQKQLPQEEHQAWKRIGRALCNMDLYNLEDEEDQNFSNTKKLGCRFLKLIDEWNEYADKQELVHQFLSILHKIALNIL